jgi:hypothetical protein
LKKLLKTVKIDFVKGNTTKIAFFKRIHLEQKRTDFDSPELALLFDLSPRIPTGNHLMKYDASRHRSTH